MANVLLNRMIDKNIMCENIPNCVFDVLLKCVLYNGIRDEVD